MNDEHHASGQSARPRVMALRRPGGCAVCGAQLKAGTSAEWDPLRKVVTCLDCVAVRGATGDVTGGGSPSTPAPIDAGVAGASARAEHERRRAKHEQQIEAKWGVGRLGKIAKALSDEPQSTRAWAEGAAGEELAAKVLHEKLGDRAVLLHDRKVPKTRGNIDHLVIASSGVWVIDAKRYRGKVERRDVGGLFRSDVRLYVGGRDCTSKIDDLGWQVDAVRNAIGDPVIPVHPCLSFVGAEWPLFFAKPFQMRGVWVSWPTKLAELIGSSTVLGDDEVDRVARLLAARLPAKTGRS